MQANMVMEIMYHCTPCTIKGDDDDDNPNTPRLLVDVSLFGNT